VHLAFQFVLHLNRQKSAFLSCFPRGKGGTWSDTKGRWTTLTNVGRLKLMIERADERVENDPMFRVPRSRGTRSILAKGEPRRMITEIIGRGNAPCYKRAKAGVDMSQNRVFDDFARLVTDASEMAQGVRREAETAMKSQLERLLATMDVVTREEFEAVKQMAAKARDDNKKLSQRVAALEAAIKAEPKGSGG
jgi:BMFP domain-containing protein YqiC